LTQKIPLGDSWQFGDNTVMCRYLHKTLVPFQPNVHCPQLGPSGGNMCVLRDYVDSTTSYPFQQTLVAWNSTFQPHDVAGLSTSSLESLIYFETQVIYPTTVAWYSVSTVVYWALLYASAKFVQFMFEQYSPIYGKLSFEHQRTSIIYILNIVYTTIPLFLQLVSSPILAGKYSTDRVGEIRVVALMITGLYLFELTYRPSMRWQLISHHFFTILAIILVAISLQIAKHPHFFILAHIWPFQATTEQSIFIALLMYRFRFPRTATKLALQFSAFQTLLTKLAFALYLYVEWGIKQARNNTIHMDIVFNVMFVIFLTSLLGVQVYGSWIVWKIALTIDQRYKEKSDLSLRPGGSTDEIESEDKSA